MVSLSIVWMTDTIDRLNIFSYTYLMKTVKAWIFIMKAILIPHLFIMFHSFKKKISKSLCISFYFWLYPSSTSAIPVELSTCTLTLLGNMGFINFSSFWQWLRPKKPRLKQPRSCSCRLVADIKISCHWLRHWFIFCSQEKFQISYILE